MYGPFCRGAIPAGAGKVQFIGRRCSTCAVCFFGARLAQANLTAQKAMREAQPELRQAFKSAPEGTAMPALRLRGMTPTA